MEGLKMYEGYEELATKYLKLMDEGMHWTDALDKLRSAERDAGFNYFTFENYYGKDPEDAFEGYYNKLHGTPIEEHLIKNVKKWVDKPYNAWKEKAILKAFISGMDNCVSQDSFELNQIRYKEIYIDEDENTLNVYTIVRDYTINYGCGSMNCTADISGVIDLNTGTLKDITIGESEFFNEDEDEEFDEDVA